MYVVTFLCNPLVPKLTDALISKYLISLGGDNVTWLKEGVAAEFSIPETPKNCKEYWSELQELEIDIVFQASKLRKKKILVADMDSTIINQECLDELADEVGYGKEIRAITKQAMEGNLEFECALIKRVKYLKGTPEKTIGNVLRDRITLSAGARTLISTMRENNSYTSLVSGGFTQFTSKIAHELGFHENRANHLEVENSKLTGNVKRPILGKESKVEVIKSLTKQLCLTPNDVIAVGDGANDIGMLAFAGTGVAMHAKKIVQEKADIIINHCDLSALLYLQGYEYNNFII
ncbi:phosphoserine phosphatase SerB [Paracoccaceae bacterium]|nr:phosphoserine phosphatase SerB [Paracoccaceae bacterium]